MDVNRPATGPHAAGCIRVAAAHRVGSLSAGFNKSFTSQVRSMRERVTAVYNVTISPAGTTVINMKSESFCW